METKIPLTGLHLLLTYRCTFECDHCFVWGSPFQDGTMTAEKITQIIDQAREVETIDWIYFEGGEPFLYYPILLHGVEYAKKYNFKVGIVTNGYWATDSSDVLLWLKPLDGKIDDFSISSDLFHFNVKNSLESERILKPARHFRFHRNYQHPQPNDDTAGGTLMYRGRAADKLAPGHECES
jgi:pyruvate-formate lyase-activating enzyme